MANADSKRKYLLIAGLILMSLVGVVLILAGLLKIINVGAEDMLEGLEKARLIQHKTTISILAIVCGLLLLVPITRKVGILMSTAYWGGAIVAHMTYNDAVVMPAAFLALLWIGVALTHFAEKTLTGTQPDAVH